MSLANQPLPTQNPPPQPTSIPTPDIEFTPSDIDVAAARASVRRSTRTARLLSATPQLYSAYLAHAHRAYTDPARPTLADDLTPIILSVNDAATIKPQPQLIENILPSNGLCFLYGREGVGKSFTALDLAFSVATGTPWFSHPVRRGPVVYLTAEGIWGLGTRILGYLQEKDSTGTAAASPLHIIPQALALHSDEGQHHFLLALHDILPDIPALIIIDTLHAYTPGADENSGQDMGRLLSFLNELRQLSGATVLIVHHARKTTDPAAVGYRGHSSLAGAADTMIRCYLQPSGLIAYRCEKQKDGPAFPEFFLQLRSVYLPSGNTTCVLDLPYASQPNALSSTAQSLGATSGPLTPLHHILANIVRSAPAGLESRVIRAAFLVQTGRSVKAFENALHKAVTAGLICKLPEDDSRRNTYCAVIPASTTPPSTTPPNQHSHYPTSSTTPSTT